VGTAYCVRWVLGGTPEANNCCPRRFYGVDKKVMDHPMKKNNGEHPVLNKDIGLIPTSEEFLEMARRNHFSTLNDILDNKVNDLLNRPLFNFRMLSELGAILLSYGLLELLDEE